MSDQITSAKPNADGSWTFGFSFDNGSGVTGTTNIMLPAPQPTTDGNGNIIAAVPYTDITAKAAVLPLALAVKNNWLAAMAANNIVGPVTL